MGAAYSYRCGASSLQPVREAKIHIEPTTAMDFVAILMIAPPFLRSSTVNGSPTGVNAIRRRVAARQAQSLRPRKIVVYKATVGFVWVAIGGAAGSCLRYGVSLMLGPVSTAHAFPWATLVVNILGSLGLGLSFVLAEDRTWLGTDLRLLLGTGVMGGFTTYSAFNLESIGLMQNGQWGRAALYMGATVVACLLGGAVGLMVGRAIRG